MGLLATTVRQTAAGFRNVSSYAPLGVSPWISGRPQSMEANYYAYAREGYASNELVYACIEERATSAAEPRMRAKVRGEWVLEHPILDLLAHPNPYMDGFEFWATVILHRDLAGNAFALKVRSASKKVVELWLMRPDLVKIVPDRNKYIARYEFDIGGGESVPIPVEDVIHFKTRNPLNQFYGHPPLASVSARVDIDNYMRMYVKSWFENAGVPGGVLAVETSLSEEAKREIKQRSQAGLNGPGGWHSWLVIDKSKATFTPITSSLGASGLVVPELEKMSNKRVCIVFGVPPALVGADDGPTSYAALEMIQRFFWDNTLAPLYKELDAPLNAGPKRFPTQPQIGLTSDFAGVDMVEHDLSDVRALREDVDKLNARLRADLMAGGITIEEFREATGREPKVTEGTFLLPSNLVPVAAKDVADDSVDLSSVRQAPAAPSEGGNEPEPAPEAA